MVANLTATAAAAWLFADRRLPAGRLGLGGDRGRAGRCWPPPSRSRARARRPAHAEPALAETERAASRYVAMLRAGLAESRHHPDVRRVLLLAAAMVGSDGLRRVLPAGRP